MFADVLHCKYMYILGLYVCLISVTDSHAYMFKRQSSRSWWWRLCLLLFTFPEVDHNIITSDLNKLWKIRMILGTGKSSSNTWLKIYWIIKNDDISNAALSNKRIICCWQANTNFFNSCIVQSLNPNFNFICQNNNHCFQIF